MHKIISSLKQIDFFSFAFKKCIPNITTPTFQEVVGVTQPLILCFVLFDLILYVPSTIFQLNRDGSSWVEPVLS